MAKQLPTVMAPSPSNTIVQPATTKGELAMLIKPPTEVAVYDDIDAVEGKPKEESRDLPIIRVLQPGSPQVFEESGIPGARPGDFYNIATNEVFSGKRGLYMIAVNTHRKVVEYVARDKLGKGGGFLNVYEPENPIVKAAEERLRKEKNLDQGRRIFSKIPNGFTDESWPAGAGKPIELVDSRYIDALFVVPNDDGSFPGHFGYVFRGSMAFQSSFLRSWDSWDTRRKTWTYPVQRGGRVENVLPTMWTTLTHVRTVIAPKASESQRWYVPQITLAAKKEDGTEEDHKLSRISKVLKDGDGKLFTNPLYEMATDLNVAILEGSVQLDFAKDAGDAPVEGAAAQATDTEIPFDAT